MPGRREGVHSTIKLTLFLCFLAFQALSFWFSLSGHSLTLRLHNRHNVKALLLQYFVYTAVLQHKRVDDDGGCGVVVECIAIAMASVCGYAGAKASLARQRAHEIVEMR